MSHTALGRLAEAVAALHGLPVRALYEPSRRDRVVRARQHAMAVMRQQFHPGGRPKYTLREIADHFGLRSPGTVARGLQAHESRRRGDR